MRGVFAYSVKFSCSFTNCVTIRFPSYILRFRGFDWCQMSLRFIALCTIVGWSRCRSACGWRNWWTIASRRQRKSWKRQTLKIDYETRVIKVHFSWKPFRDHPLNQHRPTAIKSKRKVPQSEAQNNFCCSPQNDGVLNQKTEKVTEFLLQPHIVLLPFPICVWLWRANVCRNIKTGFSNQLWGKPAQGPWPHIRRSEKFHWDHLWIFMKKRKPKRFRKRWMGRARKRNFDGRKKKKNIFPPQHTDKHRSVQLLRLVFFTNENFHSLLFKFNVTVYLFSSRFHPFRFIGISFCCIFFIF